MSSIQGRIQNPVLKHAEKNSVGKIGRLQILTSEKCTVPLKECMAASTFIELVIVLLRERIAGTNSFY